MLQNIEKLIDYPVRGADGELGRVQDIYFDAGAWLVRYLVVETGSWLSQRQILLIPGRVEPDWDNHLLQTGLAREQVQDSPVLDTALPVSRRHEAALHAYFEWSPYWSGPGLLDRSTTGGEWDDREPDLHSLNEVLGYKLQARDDKIGHVTDFIMDDDTWTLQYMIVDTGGWLPGRKVLLAPTWVEQVNWVDAEVQVDLTQETVKNSPEFDSAAALNREYETRLHGHYNRPGY